MESPIKNLRSNFIMEKNEKNWFVNISEYYHRTLGVVTDQMCTFALHYNIKLTSEIIQNDFGLG